MLVLATGFDVLRFLTTFDTVGRSGRTLREVWEDDNAQAYLGTLPCPTSPTSSCSTARTSSPATAAA